MRAKSGHNLNILFGGGSVVHAGGLCPGCERGRGATVRMGTVTS